MKNSKTAVLFASRPVAQHLKKYVPLGAFVVGADAGCLNAKKLGFGINLAVGDFDSSSAPKNAHEIICLQPEKDDTDTHFAAKELLKRGFNNIVLLGIFGGRQDHQLANYQTMLFLAQNAATVCAADDELEMHCVAPGTLILQQSAWRWLSVFAAGGTAKGVSLSGVKYPLQNGLLTPNTPLGVSNEFAAPEAVISHTHGFLFVMLSN